MLHVAVTVPENPVEQTGVHVLPLAAFGRQSPGSAFVKGGRTVHAVLVQRPATIQEPEEQVAKRVPVKPVEQTGVQLVPLGTPEVQSPSVASARVGREVQGGPRVSAQTPVTIHEPVVHVALRVPAKLALQTGVHVTPLGESGAQSPALVFSRIGSPGHGCPTQTPVIDQTPELHLPERVPANPELQTGVHTVPLAEFAAQSPTAPLGMEGNEPQAVVAQLPVTDQEPELHVAERVPANPVLQMGVHVNPLAELAAQFPGLPFAIVG